MVNARTWFWVQVFLVFIPLLFRIGPALGLELPISNQTRLMVISPHPDDESLGAAGLIQRVLRAEGDVKVVFMTSGDGFPEGVEMENHISHPSVKDYRSYGKEREKEALKALGVLGVEEKDTVFLGFPDGGLCYLLWRFRSDPQSYTSPYTRENHPPALDMIIPETEYNGNDLKKEITRVCALFRPTLVATTPPEDQHPDHCSTYHFVIDALAALEKRDPSIKPVVLTFLIHFGQWPLGQGAGTGARLNPPDGFPGGVNSWISFFLDTKEAETKRRVILEYHTQMLVMGRYLLSFARSNELFTAVSEGSMKGKTDVPCCWK